jgi:hypothetical protein
MKNKMNKNSKKSSLLDSPVRRAVIADMSAHAKTVTISVASRPSK